MAPSVLVMGAGLAGLAGAAALAARGLRVRILEARPRLGGRASSFSDPASGQLLDACQHVGMGCCTNLAHFTRMMGIAHLLAPQECLYFMTPDRNVSRFASDPLPAPLHLGRAFAGLHFLSLKDKGAIAWGLAALKATSPVADEPFLLWLRRHAQPETAIRRFWELVLVSALNETIDRVGMRYARKVFVDGFMSHPRGFQVEVPTVPLGRLYGRELLDWFDRHQVEVSLGQGVRQLLVEGGRVTGVLMRDGQRHEADWYLSALPWDRVLDVLPATVVESEPTFKRLREIESSPITSVHLWYDRRITDLPHAVLVDSLGQWLFNRGETTPGEHYLQVVISASRALRDPGHEAIKRRIIEEIQRLFPKSEGATLVRARVITEHQATFSVVPGIDRLRPQQGSPIPNLLLAGDWTATGWPATMEGAVRSGYLAAGELFRRLGFAQCFIRADLGNT
jgi:squalene-associated FAD-dependent desaturase